MLRLARIAAWVALCVLVSAATVAAQPTLTVVRAGGVQTDDITPLIYAIRTGMFRREGLDVQSIPSSSGAATAAAVVSGSYEIGKSSLLSLMNAHLRNLPLTVVAAGVVHETRNPFAKLVVAADAPYMTGKDFNGKTIAVSALNDLSQVSIDAWVDKTGGDARLVHYVELPVSAMPAAVVEHRVDGAFVLYPVLADALASGKVRAVVAAYDAIAPFFVLSCWFTTTDYAARHPDVVRKFVSVMYAAAAYTNKHHADTAAMMSDVTKTPLSIYEGMARVDAATSTNPKDWQPLIDASAKYHVIPQAFPAKDFIWSG
ncbi:MAG TPA: ABC transporter substrate-binding protein [Candidatus Binatia bacterium]|nr:ABC transporter substrate-binding protein [Candidatus Binatia bacterium]